MPKKKQELTWFKDPDTLEFCMYIKRYEHEMTDQQIAAKFSTTQGSVKRMRVLMKKAGWY